METSSWERDLVIARGLARHAGEIALRYQEEGVSAERKSDDSPVTIADRECEAFLVRMLRDLYPQDGILGEEGSSVASSNGRRWIVDPIDGTRDYVRNNPRWAVLLGLEEQGEISLGVAHFPALGDDYFAVRGQGAYCNQTRLQGSRIAHLTEAVGCVNGLTAMHRMPFAERLLPWVSQLFAVRSLGGGPDAMMLATGEADLWIEPTCQPWDLAPLQVILEEAGLSFFNFKGTRSIYEGNCVACAPGLEFAVREFLGIPLAAVPLA